MYPSQGECSRHTKYAANNPQPEETQILFLRAADRGLFFSASHGIARHRTGESPYTRAANDQNGPRGVFVGTLTGEVRLFKAIVTYWRLTPEEAGLLLGFDHGNSDLVDKIFAGTKSLQSRDSKDRVTVLFRIRRNLSALLRDADAENRWLRTPDPALSGKSPIMMMLEGSIITLLEIDQYVATIAGR